MTTSSWRRSSHCDAGTCVEVMIHLDENNTPAEVWFQGSINPVDIIELAPTAWAFLKTIKTEGV